MSEQLTIDDLKEFYEKYNAFNAIRIDLKDKRLEHRNYKAWLQEFGSQMRYYKLWTILKDDYDQAATAERMYKNMDETARDQLYNNVGEFYQQILDSEPTARGGFKKIRDHFEGNPLVQSIRIMGEFADQVQLKSDDLETALIRFKNYKADLEALHRNLPESLLIGMLVSIVPKSARDVTKELMLPKNAKVSFLDALGMFNNSLQLKREFEDSNPMKSICAFTDKPKMICLYCQAKGHAMSVCRKLESDKASGKITGDIIVAKKTFTEKGRGKQGAKQTQRDSTAPNEEKQRSIGPKPSNPNTSKNRQCALISRMSYNTLDPNKWFIDSGASKPAANSLRNCAFMSYRHMPPIYTAGDEPLHVAGIGKYVFQTKAGFSLTINNVEVCEQLAANFLALSALDEAGYTFTGGNGKMYFWDGEDCILSATKIKNGLYEVDFCYDEHDKVKCIVEGNEEPLQTDSERDYSVLCAMFNQYKPDQDVDYWHETLNHSNVRVLKRIAGRLGITVTGDLKCLVCKLAKLVKMPFPRRLEITTTAPLQLIHTDLSGIIRLHNPEGYRYFLNFQDDFTKFKMLFLLSRKYQVFDAFKQFKEYMECQTGLKIRALRSDNGGEYDNNAFNEYLKENGIDRQFTVAYNPQMNGNAERINRSDAEAARAALIGRNLSIRFWPRALAVGSHHKNRIPHSAIGHRIPYEEMFGKRVNYSKLKPFGHPVVVLELHPNSKFDARGLAAIFVGYPDNTSGYEVFLTGKQQFLIVRDVHFLSKSEIKQFNIRFGDQVPKCENPDLLRRLNYFDNENSGDRFLDDALHQSNTVCDDYDDNELDVDEQTFRRMPRACSEQAQPESPDHDQNNSFENLDHDTSQQISSENSSTLIRDFDSIGDAHPNGRFVLNKAQREKIKQKFPESRITFTHIAPHASSKKNNKKCVWDVKTVINSVVHKFDNADDVPFVPRNFRQAINCKDGVLWRAATDEEFDSLMRNEVFQLVERPDGNVRILPGMWLFKVKLDDYGRVTKYKARYVILGNRQLLVSGNTYSPVVNSLSLRILLAIGVYFGLEIHHIDIKTAYLHADLNEPVFMKQPEGYIKPGEENLVCRLSKAIYGLRSSAKEWFTKLGGVLEECGLHRLLTDECIYSNGLEGREMLVVAVYVDDLITIGSIDKLDKLKTDLAIHFAITDKGRITDCLGMQFDYDPELGEMEIRQTRYINEMLFKFGLKNCKPARTPLPDGADLFIEVEQPIEDNELYRSIIGSLLYLANNSRPDIAYAVALLSRFVSRPGKVHLEAAKRVLRYVKGTADSRIIYRKGGAPEIVIMSDSDHARDIKTSKSVSGVCSFVAGCLVGWSSFKQTRVAQSTCEAEVLSVLDGVNELEYIRDFLRELKLTEFVSRPSELFNDNQGCLSSVDNGGLFRANKHYRIRLNRVRRAVSEGLCVVKYRSTKMMIADALTKPLGFDQIVELWKAAKVVITKSA